MKLLKFVLRSLVILGLGFIVAIGAFVWMHKKNQAQISTDFGLAPEFSLVNQFGAPFSNQTLKGHPWVASFIFTRCQGPCPLITYKASQLQKDFSGTNLRLVSFSVDPEYDQPSVLKAYADTYKADPQRWFFLTGDKKTIFSFIRQSFHLAVEDDKTNSDNQIMHSTSFVLVDAAGHIRGYYNSTDQAAMVQLKDELHRILKG